MEKKKEIDWFIFTNDAYTNQAISRELPPEDIADGVKCFDGVERKLWKCDGKFVTKIQRNRRQQNFHFEVFKREGRYGSIKEATFLIKKKVKDFPFFFGKPFWSSTKVEYKGSIVTGKFIKDQVEGMLKNKNYDDLFKLINDLTEPLKTIVTKGVVDAWKNNPDFQFSNQIINTINSINEPARERVFDELVTFFMIKKRFKLVKNVYDLL